MVPCCLRAWGERSSYGRPQPLLVYPTTMVPCLFGMPSLLPGFPQMWCIILWPPQAVFMLPISVFSWGLTSKARVSVPSPYSPWFVTTSRQMSQAGQCASASAPIICAGLSQLCPLYTCCCTLLWGSEASHLSPLMRVCPTLWKIFFLHSSFPDSFVSLFFISLFLLLYPVI